MSQPQAALENIPPPPSTSDGMLFIVTTREREVALQKNLAGAPATRLALIKGALPGQPVFLFDADERNLYGPYAAEGPGAINLDPSVKGLPAQLRFNLIARKFTPLPESAVEDLLSFEESADTKGRQRPEFTIDSALVGALLWLFVLSHHGLLEGGANAQAQQSSSSSSSRRGEAPAAVPRAPRSTRVGGKR